MFDRMPDKLKELGLTEDQIIQQLSEGKTLKDQLAAKDTEITSTKTALAAAEGERNEVKNRLTELEANANRQPNNPSQNNQPNKPVSVLEDEDAAFNQRLAGPTIIALNAAKTAARLTARNMLMDQFINTAGGRLSMSKLFDRWSAEIDKCCEVVPLVNQGNPQTWLNLFDVVKGRHLEELMGKTSDFLEPVQTNTNVTVGNPPPPEKLTEDEASVLAKMNRYGKAKLTSEKVLETRKKMQFFPV